jgi:hypothetical protein
MRGVGIDTKGTVSKAIRRLEKIGLIKLYNERGTRRCLLRDPRFAVKKPVVVPMAARKTAQGNG